MPENELKRLEAVNRFLHIEINKQEEFKEISQLAAAICGVPHALITLIGQDTEYLLSENAFHPNSGRNESFCHYVLESDAVMIVGDAQLDQRLKAYPAVTRKSGIRFYAGAPLTTHDGHRLGSLCVIDEKPGALTLIQQEMLENLAKQVIQLLEFESNLHFLKIQFLEAKRLEMKMRSFFESTASSHLLIDCDLKVIAFNKAVKVFIRQAYGVEMQVGMDIKQFIQETYMADFVKNYELAMAGETIKKERLLDFAGLSVWCLIIYAPARNNDGEIIGVSFNSTDITKRILQQKTAQEQQIKLDHIAHMQSHEFRRPVASIKGLVYLLEVDGYHRSFPALKLLKSGIDEIDARIKQIVNFTVSDPDSVIKGKI